MASDDSSTVKLQPVYDPQFSATVTNSTVTFAREPTFNDVYGSGASPMIVAHDRSIQRIPPSRRIETISSVKSFGVERRESTESVSKEAYDAAVQVREAFRVRIQQLEELLSVAIKEKNIAIRNREAAIRDRDTAIRERETAIRELDAAICEIGRDCDDARASLNRHLKESIKNPFRLCSELMPSQNVRVIVKRHSGSEMVARRDFKKGNFADRLPVTWLDDNDKQVDVAFDPVVGWKYLQSVES